MIDWKKDKEFSSCDYCQSCDLGIINEVTASHLRKRKDGLNPYLEAFLERGVETVSFRFLKGVYYSPEEFERLLKLKVFL
jgi:hypothetical protein